jgi:hypothetical protein
MTGQKVAVSTGSTSDMGNMASLILTRNGRHTYANRRKLELKWFVTRIQVDIYCHIRISDLSNNYLY